ncbi:preprotein translocase subunit SecY [Candidatus Dojkabacteria bacterium]|nr:preprotein translocase subunit SecY [Candidatus Dojkabacteria bacterium]
MKNKIKTKKKTKVKKSKGKDKSKKNFIETLKTFWNNKVIRKRIFFTAGIILLYRLLANVPPPGIDIESFVSVFKDNPLTNIFTLATGGRLDNPSLVMIGLGANVNASIIIQLLSTVIPKLEELSKEGASGRQILNQYTRFLTIPLSIIQAIVIYVLLSRSSTFVGQDVGIDVVSFVATVSAGSLVLMWLGELISENGIGNGSSVIIAFSIISSLPTLIKTDIESVYPIIDSFRAGNIALWELLTARDFLYIYGLIIGLVAMVVILVLMSEAVRKITIQYARRGTGRQTNYLPLQINQAGVVPIIFASAILTFPSIVSQFFINIFDEGTALYNFANLFIAEDSPLAFLSNVSSIEYNILYFILIIAFTFFYTFVILKPSETAENLKKSGGFIPGIRPGKSTEKYITGIMIRLATIGSLFLAFITIVPSIARTQLTFTTQRIGILSGIGGTSLLIVVSVILSVYRQLKSMKVEKSYDQFR